MNVRESVLTEPAAARAEMTAWRRDLHAHPETAFEEHRTARRVAALLASFGLQPECGLAGTGVVASLRRGDGPSIGLRADLDALNIAEANDFPHRSTFDGKMHACGHDGHTAMLLGAAKHLASAGRFRGTVHFVFQPAEENEGGGRRMIEEGLFERFPMDAVFGLHNFPGLPAGRFAIRAGPFLAANDVFRILVVGRGGHAAFPETTVDPVVVAAQIILGLQTLVSRRLSPQDVAVLSVTQVRAGDAPNAIPDQVELVGTIRCFAADVRSRLIAAIEQTATGIAAAAGATVKVAHQELYPATINAEEPTRLAADVARDLVGPGNVEADASLVMGSEDFAFMLQARPGAYILLGNGGPADSALHSPNYDFNDEILEIGASYWIRLVERALPV